VLDFEPRAFHILDTLPLSLLAFFPSFLLSLSFPPSLPSFLLSFLQNLYFSLFSFLTVLGFELRTLMLALLLREITSWDRGHWGSLAGINILLCQHRPSRLVSKGWAREQRGLTFPCKQVTEAKSKDQPTCGCMWLHWLFYFPSAIWPSCFNSLSFISLLCYPLPLSCQNTACLFLFLPSSLLQCRCSSTWATSPHGDFSLLLQAEFICMSSVFQ
jgi:hypothetical protein